MNSKTVFIVFQPVKLYVFPGRTSSVTRGMKCLAAVCLSKALWLACGALIPKTGLGAGSCKVAYGCLAPIEKWLLSIGRLLSRNPQLYRRVCQENGAGGRC